MKQPPFEEWAPKPYRDNPMLYEQACLRAVMWTLSGTPMFQPPSEIPFRVLGVALHGTYPDTKLVVKFARSQEPATFPFELWDDGSGEIRQDDSNLVGPLYLASEILTEIEEHQ